LSFTRKLTLHKGSEMKPGVLYAVVANFLVNDKYLESFVTQAQADWD
jgi:hypothetical protein